MATNTAVHRRSEGPKLIHTTRFKRSRSKARRGNRSLLSRAKRANRKYANSSFLKSFRKSRAASRSILITTGLLLGTASTVAYMWLRK